MVTKRKKLNMLTKLTFPGLDLYADLTEILYMEKEIPPLTNLIMATEKNYWTRATFKNGSKIMFQESPDWVMARIDEQKAANELKQALLGPVVPHGAE